MKKVTFYYHALLLFLTFSLLILRGAVMMIEPNYGRRSGSWSDDG